MSTRTCGTVVSLLLQAVCVASGPGQVNCACPLELVVQLCLFYCRLCVCCLWSWTNELCMSSRTCGTVVSLLLLAVCVASGPGQVNCTYLELVVQLCLFYCRLCVLLLVLYK